MNSTQAYREETLSSRGFFGVCGYCVGARGTSRPRRGRSSGSAAGSIVSPLVLLVTVAVDVGAEVVAIAAILVNVSVDVRVGRTIVATLLSGFLGRRGLTMRRVPLSLAHCV
jgi:hypothetical protein